MPYAGFYINLDRCSGRRAEIEAELARFGLSDRYRRFVAADGNTLGIPDLRLNTGETGCFISHYLALKENLGSDRHLHVVEDDTVFASCTESVLRRIIESGEIDAYDILFTDIAIPLSNETYTHFKTLYDNIVVRDASGVLTSAAFQILDLNKHMAAANSSYLVNKRAIDKICRLYREELNRGAVVPVDAFLRQQADAGAIKAGCVFPFVTSARVERTMISTVRKVPDATMKFTAANIARYSFFIGCDWNECKKLLERLIPVPPPGDRHAHILSHVLAFSLLDGGAQAKAVSTKAA